MSETATLTLDRIEAITAKALQAHGASAEGATSIARAIALAEASGNAICGIHYVHKICDQLDAGAVDGRAKPVVIKTGQPARLVVDVRYGFAHRAFDLHLPDLVDAAEKHGIATLALRHSYNALDLGQFAERIAEAGLIGIAFSNSPAAVAHPGMAQKLFGTNPFAYAVPGAEGRPDIVVDMSTSAVTKNAVVLKAAAGETLDAGVAVDRAGRPTTNPQTALEEGAILAFGGHKGAALSPTSSYTTPALSPTGAGEREARSWKRWARSWTSRAPDSSRSWCICGVAPCTRANRPRPSRSSPCRSPPAIC